MNLYPMFEAFHAGRGWNEGFAGLNHRVGHQSICNQFGQKFEYRMFGVCKGKKTLCENRKLIT